MDLEVVTVGTELLLGFTIDGNTAGIGRLLAPLGCNLVRSTSVRDDEAAIRDAVEGGLSRTGIVIVTGGLGPTRDDVTKKAVAEIYDAPLELDPEYLQILETRFARYGKGKMPKSSRSQAQVPKGAVTLKNRRGTAPGLWLTGAPGIAILLPGVPEEMLGLVETEVAPRLEQIMIEAGAEKSVTMSRTVRTTGVSESTLAEDLADVEPLLAPATMAYLPGVEGVDLRLTIETVPSIEGPRLLDRAETVLVSKLADRIYGTDSTDLADVLINMLRMMEMRLSVAESCTGGMIGARLTAIPGASSVFAGGVICYENESKIRDLGVPGALLERSGAVSEQVARAMAEGVCERFGTTAAIAATGVAGPGGGTDDKPVGTVCIAARVGNRTRSLRRWYPGKRSEVRERSAQGALDLLRGLLSTSG